MPLVETPAGLFWALLTRLGEAQILLPAAVLAVLVLLRRPQGRPLAAWWLGLLAAAVALTTASKVAFIGWGLGWAALDFTGVSGHAMFAAAIYPLLLALLAPMSRRHGRWPGLVAGALLALLVGVSRVVVDAHSASEVVAGLALGAAVVGAILTRRHAPLPPGRISPWAPAVAALWLVMAPAYAAPSQSHAMVTRLALALSGHDLPHLRSELRNRVL